MYMEKQSITVVHANPNTHPGGFQGALLNDWYHVVETPDFVNKPPIKSARAFKRRNRKK
jgi:hypothetical protein